MTTNNKTNCNNNKIARRKRKSVRRTTRRHAITSQFVNHNDSNDNCIDNVNSQWSYNLDSDLDHTMIKSSNYRSRKKYWKDKMVKKKEKSIKYRKHKIEDRSPKNINNFRNNKNRLTKYELFEEVDITFLDPYDWLYNFALETLSACGCCGGGDYYSDDNFSYGDMIYDEVEWQGDNDQGYDEADWDEWTVDYDDWNEMKEREHNNMAISNIIYEIYLNAKYTNNCYKSCKVRKNIVKKRFKIDKHMCDIHFGNQESKKVMIKNNRCKSKFRKNKYKTKYPTTIKNFDLYF